MNDAKWAKFFDLMNDVVNMPGMSANEKAEMVKEKAEENAETNNLEEFIAMMN